jgi:hypothetical protein
MVVKMLIGIAIGIITMIVGYKMGYKDGWKEMYEFIRQVCPKETEMLTARMEAVYEELRRQYEEENGKE